MTRLFPVARSAEHAELTLKRQPWRASQLVAELERCWHAITDLHPELPAVVITVGAGELTRGDGLRLGRFSPCRWQLVDHQLADVFIGAEGLARGSTSVLATLLPWRRGRIQTVGMSSVSH